MKIRNEKEWRCEIVYRCWEGDFVNNGEKMKKEKIQEYTLKERKRFIFEKKKTSDHIPNFFLSFFLIQNWL
jgi:hypothetical protein